MEQQSLKERTAKELRAILDQRGVSYSDCVEKASCPFCGGLFCLPVGLQDDLIRRIEETKDIVPPQSEATIAGLSCHIVANSATPRLVVIIAHGYGANYGDFLDVGLQLGKKLKAEKVDAVFVFPNAFLPLPGGSSTQRAWWPIDFQALFSEVLSGRLHLHIPPGLDEARKVCTVFLRS